MNKQPEVNLTINVDKLPPLPVLPAHSSELPFIHKSYAHEVYQRRDVSGGINSELASHKKYEHLGDAALKILITEWVLRMPNIESGIAARTEEILLSNALFGRLAEGYGWKDKVKVGKTLLKEEKDNKVLADCFEAYFGLLWMSMIAGDLTFNDLRGYIDRLFDEEVFPDLRSTMTQWQTCRNKRRARGGEKLQNKHRKLSD